MANNIVVGPNAVLALTESDGKSMTDTGLNETNCSIVYEVAGQYKSWVPGRPINGFDTLKKDTGYIIVARQAMDLTASFAPPMQGGTASDSIMVLGRRLTDTTMIFNYYWNDSLKVNPNIVIMGSSISISLGLPTEQRMDYKLKQYIDTIWGGCTMTNIGVAGSISDEMLPTVDGGDPSKNIDAALAYNPDLILLVLPTNDALVNTPQQATENVRRVVKYARQNGAVIFVHSPIPQSAFGAADQTDLKNTNVLWGQAFTPLYFALFDSELRDKNASTDAACNMVYFQGDQRHLNNDGTTLQVNYMTPVLESNLVPNSLFTQFTIERSDNGVSGWQVFDTITDPQQIKKTFPRQEGYYRVIAQYANGNPTAYSEAIYVTEPVPQDNVLRVALSKTPVTVEIPWKNLAGDPAIASPTYTHPITGFGFRSRGPLYWNKTVGNSCAQNGWGTDVDDGNGFFFPPTVMNNYWYNPNDGFVSGTYQTEFFGLNPANKYTIQASGSRDASNGVTGPYSARIVINDELSGDESKYITNTFMNTSQGVVFTGKIPHANGTIQLSITKGVTGSVGHISGVLLFQQPVSPVTVDAGPPQTIQQPTSTVSLTGTASSTAGTIGIWHWSQVSGPASTIQSPNSQSTNVTGMTSIGTYVYKLDATDSASNTDSDTVTITVNPEPSTSLYIMLSKLAVTPPAGWVNVNGDPAATTPSYTDTTNTGWGFRSRGTSQWVGLSGSSAQDGWGTTTNDGSGFFQNWPPAAFANYWFDYNTAWNGTTPRFQMEFFNLDTGKTYQIYMTGSRSNANGATGPYSADFHVQDNVGTYQQGIIATFQNTSAGVSFTDLVPFPDGTIRIAVNKGAAGSVGHINALQIREL
jgi:hypothetical protein